MQASNCPGREQLTALKAGQLPDELLDTIADHVESCTTCQAALEQIDGDTFVSALGLFLAAGSFADESQCKQAMARFAAAGLKQIGSPARSECCAPLPQQLGQYVILEPIGHGGMGTVYKARHSKLNRVVALKTMRADRMRSPEAIARFHREMEAIGKLDHPHIVRASDAGEADGIHFLVMEFIDGIDVGKHIRRHGQLPIADACEIVRQAAVGLGHVHEFGLVHRDIKPSNLLVTASGQVKIADLGLVFLRGSQMPGDPLTETGQILGTLDYLAPEQASHTHRVDIRADLYSLGCTLYHLLVARPPFSAPQFPDALQKMFAHAQQPARPIRELRQEISATLAAIVHRLLAKDPADRYATPAEVAAALQPFVQGSDLCRLCSGQAASEPIAEPTPVSTVAPALVENSRSNPRRAWRRLTPVALAVLFALATLPFASAIYRIVTNRGVIVIKTDDPAVQVSVKRNGEEVAILDAQTNHQITLVAGVYQVHLKSGNEILKLKTEHFTLERNGREIVEVYVDRTATRPVPIGNGAAKPVENLPVFTRELITNVDFEHEDWVSEDDRFHRGMRDGKYFVETGPDRRDEWIDTDWKQDSAADIECQLRFRLQNQGRLLLLFRTTGNDRERSRLALHVLPGGGWLLDREIIVPDGRGGWRVRELLTLNHTLEPEWPLNRNGEWNELRVTAWRNVIRLEANGRLAAQVLDPHWPTSDPTPVPDFRTSAVASTRERAVVELDSIQVWRLQLADVVQQPAEPPPANPNPPERPEFLRDLILNQTFDAPEWLKENEVNKAGVRDGKFFREIAAEHAGLGYFDNWNFAASDNFECHLRFRLGGKAVLWIRFRTVGNDTRRTALWLGILPNGGWILRRNFEDFTDGDWKEAQLITIDQNPAKASRFITRENGATYSSASRETR